MIRTNQTNTAPLRKLAAPYSFDLQTTVSCYNFKLDKDPIRAGLKTGIYGRDLTLESLYTLLHFSSQQRIHFFIFVALLLILSFHSLTLVPYNIFKPKINDRRPTTTSETKIIFSSRVSPSFLFVYNRKISRLSSKRNLKKIFRWKFYDHKTYNPILHWMTHGLEIIVVEKLKILKGCSFPHHTFSLWRQ